MDISIYDLITKVEKEFTKHSDKYKMITVKIAIALDIGYSAEDILEILESDNTLELLNNIVTVQCPDESKCNLLEVGKMYYHNQLRIVPDTTFLHYDADLGVIKKDDSEYFLEMKASYCINDLIKYIETKQCFYDTDKANLIMGTVKWLLKTYNLEIVLYMIDAAEDSITFNNNNKISLIDIKKFYDKAIDARMRKKNEESINGVDSIVIRKRM